MQKGNYNSTRVIQKQVNGKFIRDVQGYRNGYNSALKTAGNYKVAGNVVGGLGLGITGYQYATRQISGSEFTIDTVMGVIGFITGCGTAISLSYFVGKAVYERYSGDTLFIKP